MYRRVLIPLDGSESAEAAVDEVFNMAPAVESVHLALVEKPVMQAVKLEGYIVYADRLMQARKEAGQEYLRPFGQKLEGTGIEVTTSVEFGEPVDSVAKLAKKIGADLVLLSGKEGGFFWQRDGMADVAPRLAKKLDMPVLLVEAAEKSGKKTEDGTAAFEMAA